MDIVSIITDSQFSSALTFYMEHHYKVNINGTALAFMAYAGEFYRHDVSEFCDHDAAFQTRRIAMKLGLIRPKHSANSSDYDRTYVFTDKRLRRAIKRLMTAWTRTTEQTTEQPSPGHTMTIGQNDRFTVWYFIGLFILMMLCYVVGGMESMAFMSVMPVINRKSVQCLLDVSQDDIDAAYDTRLKCARTLCARTDTDYQAMSAAIIAATGTMRRRTTIVLRDMIKTFNAIHNGSSPVNELGHRVTVMQAVTGDSPYIHSAVTDLHRGECEGYDAAQVLTGIKGLGPAKSSFSVQLIEPDAMTVCIDIRNVRTFGINADLKRQLRDTAFYTEFCDRMRSTYDECRYGEKKASSDFPDSVWALWVNGLAKEYSLTRNQVNEYHVRWCEVGSDIARVLCTEKYGHTPENILRYIRKEFWIK